jgi:hypothetical protein
LDRWRFQLCLTAFAFAALAAVARPSLAQSDGRAGPVGTWLIEPGSFDAWVETGNDVPWYPLLVVRADGTFTLYRVAPGCEPVLPDGGELDRMRAEDRLKGLELCAAARQRAVKDGFIAAYMHVSVAGRAVSPGPGLVVFGASADNLGPTPQLFAKHLPGLRAKLAQTSRERLSDRDRESLASLQRFLDQHEAHLSRFYTTFFVGNRVSAPFTVTGAQLRLGFAERALVYRAVKPEAPDAAMALLLNTGASAARYFRCALAKIEAEGLDAPTSDLVRLAARLRALSPDLERRADAEDLMRLGRRDEAARLWSEAEEAKMRAALLAPDRQRALELVRDGKLGQALGCPERDSR